MKHIHIIESILRSGAETRSNDLIKEHYEKGFTLHDIRTRLEVYEHPREGFKKLYMVTMVFEKVGKIRLSDYMKKRSDYMPPPSPKK